MSEKKEIRIPRLWVYLAAFGSGVVVTAILGILMGVPSAIDFVTYCALFGVIQTVSYNVWDKVEKARYRLTWQYWTLIGLIILSDALVAFSAMSGDHFWGAICLVAGLSVAAIAFIFAYCVYAPSQKEIFATVKEASKAQLKEYLDAHAGEASEEVAEGILELMFAPKKKEEAPEGEEVDE